MEYKIINKKAFEKSDTFEKRLNSMAMQGWRVITSFTSDGHLIMGKEKH
jgi:Domain of unknown function (DUF4177)